MPINSEPPGTGRVDASLLRGERWFGGKGLELRHVEPVETLRLDDAPGATLELVDAVTADGSRTRYALALRDGAPCNGTDPLWVALAREAGVDGDAATGFLADDLSNTVVVLDGRALLKLYRRPEPGPHPEAELLGALHGSPHVPRLLGSLTHGETTLLVVQELVAGDAVGWESLIAGLASGDPATGVPAALARVTVELHDALARAFGETDVVAGAPAVALPADLAHLATRIRAGLEPLASPQRAQRVHGDLHVAQFLATGTGHVVVDWEGEPGLSLAARSRPRPALRDLASLRLSLAHAARAAHRRNDAFAWKKWTEAARAEALAAYEAVRPVQDPALLHALELEKELAELAYAERWLPEWLYAPTAVLPFVLDRP